MRWCPIQYSTVHAVASSSSIVHAVTSSYSAVHAVASSSSTVHAVGALVKSTSGVAMGSGCSYAQIPCYLIITISIKKGKPCTSCSDNEPGSGTYSPGQQVLMGMWDWIMGLECGTGFSTGSLDWNVKVECLSGLDWLKYNCIEYLFCRTHAGGYLSIWLLCQGIFLPSEKPNSSAVYRDTLILKSYYYAMLLWSIISEVTERIVQ